MTMAPARLRARDRSRVLVGHASGAFGGDALAGESGDVDPVLDGDDRARPG